MMNNGHANVPNNGLPNGNGPPPLPTGHHPQYPQYNYFHFHNRGLPIVSLHPPQPQLPVALPVAAIPAVTPLGLAILAARGQHPSAAVSAAAAASAAAHSSAAAAVAAAAARQAASATAPTASASSSGSPFSGIAPVPAAVDDPNVPQTAHDAAEKEKERRAKTKSYNRFNIFFMLERQLLLHYRGGGIDAISYPIDTRKSALVKHKALHLPPLCRRYGRLPLTSNWFLELLSNQNTKRKHERSQGIIPFKELAQTVAKNYREIDHETQSFVDNVAERLGWHLEEVEAIDVRVKEAARGTAKADINAEDRRKRAGGGTGRRGTGTAENTESKGGGDGERKKRGRGKRKDPPPEGGVAPGAAPARSLSRDEAVTVGQLVGMKESKESRAGSPSAVLHPPAWSAHLSRAARPPAVSDGSKQNPSRIEGAPSLPSSAAPRSLDPTANQQRNAGGNYSEEVNWKRPPTAQSPANSTAVRSAAANSAASPSMMNQADPELERLQVELVGALNDRHEVDRRIRSLKDQVTDRVRVLGERISAYKRSQQAAAAAAAAARARERCPPPSPDTSGPRHRTALQAAAIRNLPPEDRQYLANLLAAGDSPVPACPAGAPAPAPRPALPPPAKLGAPAPAPRQADKRADAFQEIEQAILKGILARSIDPSLEAIYPAGVGVPPAAAPRPSEACSMAMPAPDDAERARPEKRRRIFRGDGPIGEGGDGGPAGPPAGEGSGRGAAAAAPSQSRSESELGFYKDVYANLLAAADRHPGGGAERDRAASAAASTRDICAHALHGNSLGMGGSDDGGGRAAAARRAMLESLMRVGRTK